MDVLFFILASSKDLLLIFYLIDLANGHKKRTTDVSALNVSGVLLFISNRFNRVEKLLWEFDDVKLRGQIKIIEGGKCLKRGVNLPFSRTDESRN